ncbi:MAG: nucleoside triphosphate pyrophosphohydrolase [Gammaproteobacteria bacterium]|nr:nucleoside triphosphate pyrophosphohydrolase [Gammaproteobacteria bacterium]
MKELRHPEHGCPWDIEQTFNSIAPYTIEEAYEVADAIQRHDMDDLKEELGDLLFQVVFHTQMAAEQSCFDFDGVVTSIVEKMLRRHPHVFGGAKIKDAKSQTHAWEKHKHAERQQKLHGKAGTEKPGILDGIPIALPALTRAVKLQRRAARIGFDWTSLPPVFEKIAEELEEVKTEIRQQADRQQIEAEIGDLFFAVTNLARHLEIDPETALRSSNTKFERRFRAIETLAGEQNRRLDGMTLDEMEKLYQQIKQAEKPDIEKDGE